MSELRSLGIPDRRDSEGSHSGFDQGMQNQGIVTRGAASRVVPHVSQHDRSGTGDSLFHLRQGLFKSVGVHLGCATQGEDLFTQVLGQLSAFRRSVIGDHQQLRSHLGHISRHEAMDQ